ncbi:NAD(P)/FAD-dependent oxidoreductase, partial [bacterium]|nr:NAD(P)/FAD-dependent oxidoreductase [bacterium]
MKYDYLVIGAGVSGISSALLLARFGFRVALLEQASGPAPLIDGFVRNGVYFEAGFHYAGGLESGGVLDRSLSLLGVAEDLHRVAFDELAYDTIIQPESGLNFSFPQGYDALSLALQKRFPEQRNPITKYLGRVQEVTQNLPYYHPQAAFSPLSLAALHEQSLEQVFAELAISGELRTLLQVHCLLYGTKPSEVPFAIHAGVVDGYYRSASTFKGGGRALVKALVAACERSGVDLFCRHQVSEVELTAAGAFAGLACANGERLQAVNCVSTIHPKAMLALVPDSVFRPVYRRRLNALAETASAEIVFLRCERQRGSALGGEASDSYDFAGRNFFFLPSPGTDLFAPDLPLCERLLYLNFASSGGFTGAHECGITAILPAASEVAAGEAQSRFAYAEGKVQIGEQVRERISGLLPELGAGLKVECVATKKTLQRINLSPTGSLYGVKHMVGQFNPAAKTRLENFFLAGQAT